MAAEIRIGIDVGASSVVAVGALADGSCTPLAVDGGAVTPSGVFVNPGGELVPGVAGLERALRLPALYVEAPLRRLGDGVLVVGERRVEAVDLVAAVLRPVCEAATARWGRPGEVSVVTPAGWGPARRLLLRQAAHRAGLAGAELVEAPVAIARRVAGADPRGFGVGRWIVVVDVGAGCEVSVVRRNTAGFEVVATMAADAGGDRIDAVLAARLLPVLNEPAVEDGYRRRLVAAVRSGKEQLGTDAAVKVVLPGASPPLVVPDWVVREVSEPVFAEIAALVRSVIEVAQVPAETGGGVWLAGGGALLARVEVLLGEATGLVVRTVANPVLAAACGGASPFPTATATATAAVSTASAPVVDAVPRKQPVDAAEGGAVVAASATEQVGEGSGEQGASVDVAVRVFRRLVLDPVVWTGPPVARSLACLVPFVGALALWWHASATGYVEGTVDVGDHRYMVINWGELAMACALMTLSLISLSAVFTAAARTSRGETAPEQAVDTPTRFGGTVAASAVCAVLIAACGAVLNFLVFGIELTNFLVWSIGPTLPFAIGALLAAGLISTRRLHPPAGGWHPRLAPPTYSIIAATAGMLLMQYSHTLFAPGEDATRMAVRLGGGILLGAATALIVPASPLTRAMLAIPALAFGTVAAVKPSLLACVWIGTATAWWARRVWSISRLPTTTPAQP
ncbi:Hsp70 family protein [Virgisporangium aliadipatigenens]|uniref:Hsp70 family protein n=1 Tax=Virgisporangium aliadipatigenens TaxID=741659 RepID=UPI0019408B12|nr:Hsp70 family protein [Virgisporangium aliadipatigenens]